MNVTISFDEHRVRNTEKIEDIKVLMLKGEKGDAGMTPEDVMDIVEPYLETYAPLNSPALTGTPTAPTATAGSDTTQIATTAYVKNEVDSKLSSTYKAKGSVAFASLPALIAANAGNVYNVTDAFTTTNDFVEGSGKSYPAGTNVVIVNTTGTTYKYDVLSGFVDLSGYLTASDAANTYLSQSDASSTYLTQSDASSTYLTQSSASSTYATQTALGNTNAKVGSGTLDIGSDLTDGVNQLNSNLSDVSLNINNNLSGANIFKLRIDTESSFYENTFPVPNGARLFILVGITWNGGACSFYAVSSNGNNNVQATLIIGQDYLSFTRTTTKFTVKRSNGSYGRGFVMISTQL
jgi:hypothetical protein